MLKGYLQIFKFLMVYVVKVNVFTFVKVPSSQILGDNKLMCLLLTCLSCVKFSLGIYN